MNNHEDVYDQEAQEEILNDETLQRRHGQKQPRVNTEQALSENEDENSPLMGSPGSPQRAKMHKRGYSYERAINEPWTGAHGLSHLPWYKKPSVSTGWLYDLRLC